MGKLAKALSAAAGNAGGDNLYVEDVFSTFVYTGTDANKTIVNGIDLSGEGGLVWIKNRSGGSGNNLLLDTVRGVGKYLISNNSNAQGSYTPYLSAFNSNGFTTYAFAANWASWTFRKAEKFFDIVQWTGTANASTVINHNVNGAVGMIIVKRTSGTGGWAIYHKSLGTGKYINFDTYGSSTDANFFPSVTSTNFRPGSDGDVNQSGITMTAWVFGDEAAFGDDGDEPIVKFGSFTTDGNYTPQDINLGFEPQWFMYKRADAAGNWYMADIMRGWTAQNTSGESAETYLYANLSSQEASSPNTYGSSPNATGINWRATGLTANSTYIYMAIRRPMKTPTAATEVFNIGTYGANRDDSSTSTYYAGFPVDMALKKVTVNDNANNFISTRMLGLTDLKANSGNVERTGETDETFDSNTHWNKAAGTSSTSYSWMWRRAAGFFDVVAYTGDGVALSTRAHNLGVVPELAIIKRRDNAGEWEGYGTNGVTFYNGLNLNLTDQANSTNNWSLFYPTYLNKTFISPGVLSNNPNSSSDKYIMYLFATLAGVSKVGTYTANANSTNIACGFSGTARFLLIKRLDSSGDWYVWDSSRGISAAGSNDPYLLMNTSAAQITNTDYVAPYAGGFNLTTSGSSTINVNNGTYIFLAIA